MKGKSPMMKALIGKQNNLPEQLKAKILAAPDSPAKMMKKSPAKKKTEREKLNKLVEKRTKLRDRKVKREDKEKNTRRVDRKLEKNQAKINKNSKAQEDRNKPKNKQKGGERMVPTRVLDLEITKKGSIAKMKKASPTKMAKKSPTKRLDTKSKKVNPFSAEYKRMTVSQRRKKYNPVYDGGGQFKNKDDFEKIGSGKKGTIKTALSGLNERIKEGAANVSRVIKGKNKDGTSKGGLVIKSEKNKTTGKRSTTITRANNTDKKTGGNSGNGGNGGNGGGDGGGGNGGYKPVTFKGKKGDKFTYRTLKGGGFEFMRPGSTEFEKATKKGNEAISKIAPTKMKKKSSMKMMKKK